MFKLAKNSAIKSRTQAVNQLKAVLAGANPTLRDTMASISTPILIKRCAQLYNPTPSDTTSAAAYL